MLADIQFRVSSCATGSFSFVVGQFRGFVAYEAFRLRGRFGTYT
jgi:hypothetical protein